MNTVIERFIHHPIKKCLESLALAAAYSAISQLSLSPVYGSTSASIYHQRLILITILLAYATKVWYGKELLKTFDRWVAYLPRVAFAAPSIQYLLSKQSSWLGPLYGPVATEICTYVPILFLSILIAATEIDKVGLDSFGKGLSRAASGTFVLVIFIFLRGVITEWMIHAIGRAPILSRTGLQYAVTAVYALKFPSRMMYIWALILSLPLLTNYHLPSQGRTAALNQTLLSHGYSLVARSESLTGYISVLDNVQDGFRVMRCDHSLLGGEWINTPKRQFPSLREPIYAIFTMLEAVRLVVSETQKSLAVPDREKHALVMYIYLLSISARWANIWGNSGLGIGTTPAALITHGIQTTVVEIDPVVHQYASRHFNLPKNHTAVIQDAVTFVDKASEVKAERSKYDYIVHDVFTGGVEPAALFTLEFLTGLSHLLKTDGVVAIVRQTPRDPMKILSLTLARTTREIYGCRPQGSSSTQYCMSSPAVVSSAKKPCLMRRI